MRTQTGETAGREEALTVSRLNEGQLLSNNIVLTTKIFFLYAHISEKISGGHTTVYFSLPDFMTKYYFI
jgi:hypothetical protein